MNSLKPIIRRINTFDADVGTTVSFSWTGDRSYGSKIIIYNNETLEEVYTSTKATYALTHEIPAGVLTNGEKWVAQLQVYDEYEDFSPLSDKVAFYTIKTPDFYFYGLPENRTFSTPSFNVSVYYHSDNAEEISTYKFSLYDNTKRLLFESEMLYEENITYTYKGLDNDTHYFIRCEGITKNGMVLDTGYEDIEIYYSNPSTYARVYTENNPNQGCIHVSSNIIIIQYNGEEEFTYEDGFINLMDKTLYYDEGFLIEDDYTIMVRARQAWHNGDILVSKNQESGNGIKLSSKIYRDGKLRYKLTVPNGISDYVLYSNGYTFTEDDIVTICIRKKNNVYQLTIFIKYEEVGSFIYGNLINPPDIKKKDIWINTKGNIEKESRADVTITYEETAPEIMKRNDLWFGK